MLKQMRQSVVCESAKSSSRHLRNFSGSLKLYQLQNFFKKLWLQEPTLLPGLWTYLSLAHSKRAKHNTLD